MSLKSTPFFALRTGADDLVEARSLQSELEGPVQPPARAETRAAQIAMELGLMRLLAA
jgi:hypothetical protein